MDIRERERERERVCQTYNFFFFFLGEYLFQIIRQQLMLHPDIFVRNIKYIIM